MLRVGSALVLLSLSVVAPLHAQAPAPPAPQESVVVVSGEGLVQATPDRAWIMVSAESRAPSPREAQRRTADLMRPVFDALRSARVPDEAVRTTGYDLQQEFDFTNGKRVARGYVARNSVEVRVDDVGRVGELLEAVVNQGATSVSGLRFDMKDQAKLEREAVRRAVTNARLKAEAAAAGAGRALDRLLRIQEAGSTPPPVPMPFARAVVAEAGGGAPPVAAGQIEVRAQVTVTFSLK
ncbi:MAG TPA: SIMPL domain-containing protein [Vicinamibacterales bacterium]|jgi:hypothetical protein|nr:SIMPL domain-containing protein [Vicinamibacterales bacterium]